MSSGRGDRDVEIRIYSEDKQIEKKIDKFKRWDPSHECDLDQGTRSWWRNCNLGKSLTRTSQSLRGR